MCEARGPATGPPVAQKSARAKFGADGEAELQGSMPVLCAATDVPQTGHNTQTSASPTHSLLRVLAPQHEPPPVADLAPPLDELRVAQNGIREGRHTA